MKKAGKALVKGHLFLVTGIEKISDDVRPFRSFATCLSMRGAGERKRVSQVVHILILVRSLDPLGESSPAINFVRRRRRTVG